MNFIKSTLEFIVLVLNLLVGIGLLVAAYGHYISPAHFPILSIAGLGFSFFAVLNLAFVAFWLLIHPRFVWLPVILYLFVGDALLTYCPFSMGSSPQEGKVLKVLTYNTMGFVPEKDSKGKNVYPALEYIKQSGADIVCLQEVPLNDKEIIRQAKSVYPYIKTVSLNNGFHIQVACMSKTPISSAKRIEVVSSGNGAALFQVKVGDKQIPVIIAHLESNKLNGNDKEMYESLLENPKNRLIKSRSKHLLSKLADAASLRGPQAEIIAQKIQEINSPHIIVCGDFNDIALSYSHRIIGKGLQDTYREAGFGPGNTYHEHFMLFRIDHMMVGKAYRVLKCKIDKSIKASDHYPYWCELELKK